MTMTPAPAPEWIEPPLFERAVKWAQEFHMKRIGRDREIARRVPEAFRLADLLGMCGELPRNIADITKHPDSWDATALHLARERDMRFEHAALHLANTVCERPESGPRGRPRKPSTEEYYIRDAMSFLTGPMWNMAKMDAVRVVAEAFGMSQDGVFKAIKK